MFKLTLSMGHKINKILEILWPLWFWFQIFPELFKNYYYNILCEFHIIYAIVERKMVIQINLKYKSILCTQVFSVSTKKTIQKKQYLKNNKKRIKLKVLDMTLTVWFFLPKTNNFCKNIQQTSFLTDC